MSNPQQMLDARLLEESEWLDVAQLCRACQIDLALVVELAEVGLVSPRGGAPSQWQLPASALLRLRVAGRLMRDLGVNVSGAALVVELLEEQRGLERRLGELERLIQNGD